MAAAPPFSPLCADLLRAGQTVRFAATGTSMAPAIRDGDVLTVEPVPASQVRLDDVVLYLAPRGLTAHRVVGTLAGAAFEACGDAPGSPVERVPEAAVLGRVTRVERRPRSFAVRLAAACRRAKVRLIAGLVRRRYGGVFPADGREGEGGPADGPPRGLKVDEPSQPSVDRREINS